MERVGVLGRGVDTDLFHPAQRDPQLRGEWGATDDAPVIAFVGRIAAEKNLPLAVKAMNRVMERMPGSRAVLVGDGPKAQSLRESCPQFVHAGQRSGRDLARHYASADVFLFTSLTETYGNVLAEAMASGLVTVSYDYAAAHELVEHGVNGFKAAPGDEAAFLAALDQAVARWHDASMRQRARATTLALSWEAIVTNSNANCPGPSRLRGARRDASAGCHHFPMKRKLRFKTIFISDVHLGAPECKAAQAGHFLRHSLCEKLVMNGDIIDAWALRRNGKWTKSHTHFIRSVLRKMEKEDTEVIYTRGNHDDVLARFLPIAFDNLRICEEHIHESPHGKYLVVHGDGFDHVTTNHSGWRMSARWAMRRC